MWNQKKADQLGMPIGTATARLRKAILFSLLQELDRNTCYRCGEEIKSINELTIEHKEPWLDNSDPSRKFFDLTNIAFSHSSCNISSGRRLQIHGTRSRYHAGCRCHDCRSANAKHKRERLARRFARLVK